MTSQSDRDTAPAALECQSEIDKDLVRTYYGDIGAFYTVRAALAATPAVGGERATELVQRFEMESMALHKTQREWLVREIGKALAAPPASPLRGREARLLADRLRWLNNERTISMAQVQEICGKLGEIIFFLDQFSLPNATSEKE